MPKHEYGREGAHLQNQALRSLILWAGLPFLALIVLLALVVSRVLPWQFSFVLVLAAPLLPRAWRAWESRVNAAVDPKIAGFRGEFDVAEALRVLGDDCYLVHDVDLGRGNVDHVAIAPSGVYTIETKAWEGSVRTQDDRLLHNGFDHTQALKQAYAEAMGVRDYIVRVSRSRDSPDGSRYYVTPLLVFTRANVTASGKSYGVFVMPVSRLAGFIQRSRPTMWCN